MNPRPLPPYTHIPGVTPHPIRDPAGHSYEAPDASAETAPHPAHAPLIWAELPDHPEFRWAVQLFNAGYYWESHEAWESLWHAAGRTGPLAVFLKGLIKLAAAGVKLREHNLVGVERHARRARELFTEVHQQHEWVHDLSAELSLSELILMADQLLLHPPRLPIDRTGIPCPALARLPWPTK